MSGHPLSEAQQQQVFTLTRDYIEQATTLFDIDAGEVDINFSLRGRNAGMYRVRSQGRGPFRRRWREIRYNPHIFARYFADNLRSTVPHEVAHYVSDLLHGLENIKPHGREWKGIMRAFGADDSVTARYDLDGIPHRRLTRFRYRCGCRQHSLTSIRHNRIRRKGVRYYCTSCKQALEYIQD